MSKILKRFEDKFTSNLESMDLMDYLAEAKINHALIANPAERLLTAIGEPVLINTATYADDPALGRLYNNRIIKTYPTLAKHYIGQEKVLDELVSYLRSASRGLEAAKQILYLLGPVGGGKSSLAEQLKRLMEHQPFYALAVHDTNKNLVVSPIHENPLGLFSLEDEEELGLPGHYLTNRVSPWLTKRLTELKGDISKLKVVKIYPDESRHIAIAKTEPGDENNQDISTLVGKLDLSKAMDFSQSDPDAYEYSGALCRGNRGIMEFVEMFKAPIKTLHPLLTATQEHNYNPTEQIPSIPHEGIILAHSNISEWEKFSTDKNNEAFIDRTYTIKVPYEMRLDNVVKIISKEIANGALKNKPLDPHVLKTAATFQLSTVLTDNSIDKQTEPMLSKIRIYNGENIKGEKSGAKSYQEHRTNELNAEEGMDSVMSLRDLFKIIANVFDAPKDEVSAVTPDLFLEIDSFITKLPNSDQKKKIGSYFTEIKAKYFTDLDKDIQKAFLGDRNADAQRLYERYFSLAEAWVNNTDYSDPHDGGMFNHDQLNAQLSKYEKALKEFDTLITNPKDFRRAIVDYTYKYKANNKGEFPKYTEYNQMAKMLENAMLVDFEKYVSVIVKDQAASEEQKQVVARFEEDFIKLGYTTSYMRNRVLNFWNKYRVS